MELKLFETHHIDECLAILNKRYAREQVAVASLPSFGDYLPSLGARYESMAQYGTGRVLVVDGRVRGMMCGYPVRKFFGNADGVFVPVWANLVDTDCSPAAATELYSACAEEWVRGGMTSHLINIFAHERETFDALVRSGFGMRCVDAIRPATRIVPGGKAPEVVPVEKDRVEKLADLHRQHNLYYRESPMFMPVEEEDPVKDLLDWLEPPDRYLFGYFEGDRCLGYARLQKTGDSIFSSHPSIMNVTALYVTPEARRKSVGTALLDAAMAFLAEKGIPLGGVDYESINPTGSRFWERYFTPYSLSLARRVDERIVGLPADGHGQ